jgi:small subunit ribosomal protein S9
MPDSLKAPIIEEPEWTKIDLEEEEDSFEATETVLDQTELKTREPLADGRMYATGRRKRSVARVFLKPEGTGKFTVNGRPLHRYFWNNQTALTSALTPFVVTRTLGHYDVECTVKGGGNMGQANAVRHGIATALRYVDPALRAPLKANGLLTLDSRKVERKKPGLRKARRAKQWVKR